jgi:hypothetical protein
VDNATLYLILNKFNINFLIFKSFKMKAVLSFLLGLFMSFSVQSQTPGFFDMTIEKSTTNDTVIVVKVTPTALGETVATSGNVIFSLAFTITWPSTYIVDLNTATITSPFGIQAFGPMYTTGAAGVRFRSFGMNNTYTLPANWVAGTPVTLMTIKPIQNVATLAVGDFSINPFSNVLVPTPYVNLSTEPYIAFPDGFGQPEYFEPTLIGTATSVVLPLELLSFDAKAGKNAIDLRWKTAKEENFRGFNIERSLDGKKYTSIGFEAGKNVKGADYTFTDRNVVNGQVYYYRLRMVDNDGRNSVSDIRSAVLQGAVVASTGVNIYPNPTTGDVNLDFILDTDTHTMVDVFDVTGKNVLHKEVEAKRDRNIISLEMLNMASGVYAVRINMGGKIINKLVKVAKQ